jgi:hypothetical protein
MGNKIGFKVVALAAISLALSGCVHDVAPAGEVSRSTSPGVIKQVEYAKAHYKSSNTKEFGDLGGVDCVNFTSQTLIARGWKMTPMWGQAFRNGKMEYTRAWINSTGFRDFLAKHPELATPVTYENRDTIVVGDIVQFDWDNSGDRDHTGIISGIREDGTLLVASHSPSAFDWPLDEVILSSLSLNTKTYFWHLKN